MTGEPDNARIVRRFITAALLMALLFLPAAAQPQLIFGKVVSVSDGDTITILDKQKRQYKIRLEG